MLEELKMESKIGKRAFYKDYIKGRVVRKMTIKTFTSFASAQEVDINANNPESKVAINHKL